MMKLHWSPRSPYVRKVMICIAELGLGSRIELQRSVAAMTAPNPRLMQDNPLSKIPTLVLEDGLTLFDSAVICEYLNHLAHGDMFPAAPPQRWQSLRWQALGNGLLDVLILWRNEREREEPLAVLMAAFESKTMASLGRLESEATALAQAPFSIGSITVGCALGYLDYRFGALQWRARASSLARWYESLCGRPSFMNTVPRED